jgi:protein ImuA
VAAIEASGEASSQPAARLFALDGGDVDAALGGGLACGTLHEIHAASGADNMAASGFAAALTLGAAQAGRPVIWIRQDYAARENGELHADGLAALGLDPASLILVKLRDPLAVLRAGIEVARCAALGAVIVEVWGEPKALDLTTQRRLVLAAEASGVTIFLLRPGAAPSPGSAETRWLVRAGAAEALAMNSPGHPTFDLTLLRHRHGPPGGPWRLEWNRDAKRFKSAALLRHPVALPELQPPEAPAAGAVLPFERRAALDRRDGEGRASDRRAGSGGA